MGKPYDAGMFMQLSETAGGLRLAYPAWLPLVCAGLALACGYTAVWRPAQWKDRRWAGFVVCALLAFAALHFGSYRAQFDASGASQRSLVGTRFQFAWSEVHAVREERSRARGRPCCLIVVDTGRGAFEFSTVDLEAHSRERVRRYLEERSPKTRH